MKNELIVLEQLPIIKAKLEQISKEIQERVDKATSLVVNEETVKEVKKERAELNKEFNELETQRKQVKQAIMSKYEEFEEIYNEKVSHLYKDADSQLKEKIDAVENELKSEKENELRDFFNEYRTSNHLESVIDFENVGLNITISASMKSLKEQIKAFCEKVANDIKAIETEENPKELLLEYKFNGFDYAKAKTTLAEKQKQLERITAFIAKNGEEIKQDEINVQNIETMVSAPKEIEEEPKNWYSFEALMTEGQAKELKHWFNENEIETR